MDLIIIFGIIFFIIGLAPLFIGMKYHKFRKLVLKTPTSKIWDLHNGLVEIYGEVEPSDEGTMVSPITQKECVYYKYKIQEYRSHGKGGSYVTISKGKAHRLFYLRDMTGFVLVDSRNAKIDIFNKYKITTSFFRNIPDSAIPFLEKNNIRYKSYLVGHKNMRFEEEVIMPYKKIYLLGSTKNRFNLERIPIKPGEAAALIQKGAYDEKYYMADATESQILSKYKIREYLGLVSAASIFLVGIAIIVSLVF